MKCVAEDHVRCCGGSSVSSPNDYLPSNEIVATTTAQSIEAFTTIATEDVFGAATTESPQSDSDELTERMSLDASTEQDVATTTELAWETTTAPFEEEPTTLALAADDEPNVVKVYPSEMSGKPKQKMVSLGADENEIDVYDNELHSALHLIFPARELPPASAENATKGETTIDEATAAPEASTESEAIAESEAVTNISRGSPDEENLTLLASTTEALTTTTTTTAAPTTTTSKVPELSPNKTESRFQRYRRLRKTSKPSNAPIIAADKSISDMRTRVQPFIGNNSRKFTTQAPAASTTPAVASAFTTRKRFFKKRAKLQANRKSEENALLSTEHEARIESLHSVLSMIGNEMMPNYLRANSDLQKEKRNKLLQVKGSIRDGAATPKSVETLPEIENRLDEASTATLDESITTTAPQAEAAEELAMSSVSTAAPEVTTISETTTAKPRKMRRRPHISLLMDVSSRRKKQRMRPTTAATTTAASIEIETTAAAVMESESATRSRDRITPTRTPTSGAPSEEVLKRISSRIINRSSNLPRQYWGRGRLLSTRAPRRPSTTEESEVNTSAAVGNE